MPQYPNNYKWIASRFEGAMEANQNLGKELQNAGPLDKKTIQLIQLAGAAANQSEGSVHSHIKRSREEGASADEIYHCLILLTSVIGFPNTAAALAWARDVLEKD